MSTYTGRNQIRMFLAMERDIDMDEVYLEVQDRLERARAFLPDNLSTTLQGPQGRNVAHHRFTEIGPNAERTRWARTVGYKLKGLKIRLMTIFNPGVFRRQNEAYMGLFKAFCERGDDDRATKGD